MREPYMRRVCSTLVYVCWFYRVARQIILELAGVTYF